MEIVQEKPPWLLLKIKNYSVSDGASPDLCKTGAFFLLFQVPGKPNIIKKANGLLDQYFVFWLIWP